MAQLYHDIFDLNEVDIRKMHGETVRYGRVASLDIFYKSNNGKTYKLREERYKLKPGKTPDDALKGNDMTALEASPWRHAPNSLSERAKITGEDLGDTAIRALHEELFDSAIKDSQKQFPNLNAMLKDHLVLKETRELRREAGDPSNSYRGISSIYDEHIYSIEFTPDMDVPISVDSDGVPQRLYESLPEEGYLNFFVWDEVPNPNDTESYR